MKYSEEKCLHGLHQRGISPGWILGLNLGTEFDGVGFFRIRDLGGGALVLDRFYFFNQQGIRVH